MINSDVPVSSCQRLLWPASLLPSSAKVQFLRLTLVLDCETRLSDAEQRRTAFCSSFLAFALVTDDPVEDASLVCMFGLQRSSYGNKRIDELLDLLHRRASNNGGREQQGCRRYFAERERSAKPAAIKGGNKHSLSRFRQYRFCHQCSLPSKLAPAALALGLGEIERHVAPCYIGVVACSVQQNGGTKRQPLR